ncbi:MAG TPA: sugar ABC transporter permease [Aggregatilineales bacterium]|nr:sugar ABC transporter permease [Aggregatilineales bacterium]
MGINNRVSIAAAVVSFCSLLVIGTFLIIIRAVPFPFLLLIAGLGAAFAGGLILRVIDAGSRPQAFNLITFLCLLVPPLAFAVNHPRRRALNMAFFLVPLVLFAGLLTLRLAMPPLLSVMTPTAPVEDATRVGDPAYDAAFRAERTEYIRSRSGLVRHMNTAYGFIQTIFETPLQTVALFYIFYLVTIFATWAAPPFLFLGVPLTLYSTWVIYPMVATILLGTTNWDSITPINQVQLFSYDNMARLFSDNMFKNAFLNNLKWLAFFLLVPTVMGLAMAMIFNNKFPGNRVFKMAFFAPLVISPVVVAKIWEAMYRPDTGLINSVLNTITGIPIKDLPGWMADPNLVLWCIIVAAAWRQVGYVMILYLAGLKSLDSTLLEAATVDGANRWQQFWNVIFPLLGPVTVVVLVISVIDSLRAFELVAITTNGQPGGASQVIANYMYIEAFNNYNMGYASATAVVLLGIMLVFIIPYLIRTARTELEY